MQAECRRLDAMAFGSFTQQRAKNSLLPLCETAALKSTAIPPSIVARHRSESGLGLLSLCLLLRFSLHFSSVLADSAKRLDLLACALGELVRHDGELLGQVAVAENLQGLVGLSDEAKLLQGFAVNDLDASFQLVLKNVQVHHDILCVVGVVETALGQAPDKRNLTTFKVGSAAVACSGSRTLLTATSGAPMT